MKLFSAIFTLLFIGCANQANARRRHLTNTIKGDESNASMSMSYASMSYASIVMAKGGNSKGKSSKGPTPAPSPHDTLQPGECGSTITKDFVLLKNLDCDCTPVDDNEFGYALKIDGRGVTLNLNGHTVSCPSGFGQKRINGLKCGDFGNECDSVIQVDGTANSVVGGTVLSGTDSSGRGNGIKIVGGGFHTVDNVNVGPIEFTAIDVRSANNVISNSHISESSRSGISIGNVFDASKNTIRGNTIVGCEKGIQIGENALAADNQILNNNVFNSFGDGAGIDIFDLAKRTIIRGNLVNGNKSGINDSGTNDIVDSNTVTNNGLNETFSFRGGIVLGLFAQGPVVTNNIAVGNGLNGDNNFVNLSFGTPTIAGNIFEMQSVPSL